MKICLVASAGGHLSQLSKLAKGWDGFETFCITTTNVVVDKCREFGRVYVVGECNYLHPFKALVVFARCVRIIYKEKPIALISTGAACGCISCFLAKFLGAKIIWIDSVTNVERLSLSGRMVRYIADLFLVQWPEHAKKYKNVEYCGTII